MRRTEDRPPNRARQQGAQNGMLTLLLAFISMSSLALGIYVAGWLFLNEQSATYVYLKNEDANSSVDGILLHVSGNSYSVGPIEAGKTKLIRVWPRFDSHLEIERVSSNKTQWREVAGGYIDGIIPGEYRVLVHSGGIRSSDFNYRKDVYP